jgi:signal transduction histidine kinase
MKDRRREAFSYSYIGFTFLQLGFFEQAVKYLPPAVNTLDSAGEWIQASFTASNAASSYTSLGRLDSADLFNARSLQLWERGSRADKRWYALRTLIFDRIATTFEAKGDIENAKLFFHQSLYHSTQDKIIFNIPRAKKNLARIFMLEHNDDSARYYATQVTSGGQVGAIIPFVFESALILDTIYRRKGITDSVLYYQTMAMDLQDSLLGPKKFKQLQQFLSAEQERHQQEEIENKETQATQRLIILSGALLTLLTVVFILRRGNKTKQQLNAKLQDKNLTLEHTLDRLKSTQSQLIQAEKMASLGELTAGIAHEIQNPLNFVNNFSELNKELITEMQDETDEVEKKQLALTISENLDKVIVHGRRADAIVKSMLQHSKASSGHKELRDLNLLCEEYLGLAYHGMRAKENQFNASMIKDFDASVGMVEVYPQDISRVLLNLLNNAFYAIHEKSVQGSADYRPKVSMITKRISSAAVTITIADNGTGIPEEIRQKIFQPFFTTKPTGEGTGLGLSLSYDVIVKGHGGDITVTSQEGMGTAFVITLPG